MLELKYYSKGEIYMIHVPKFAFRHTTDAEHADSAAFGGLPFGLPEDQWPICPECEGPLTFLFQMEHHNEYFPLGKKGRVLYLFQCESEEGCSSWEADSGCNHVLILEPEEFTNTVAEQPDEDILILPELVVIDWETSENQEQIKAKSPFGGTRWGGDPQWIQSPENPPASYQFIAQIGSGFYVQVSDVSELEYEKTSKYNGSTSYQLTALDDEPYWISESGQNRYHCPFANFGDAGTGYLFVNPDPKKPTGKFLWQCS